MHASNGDEYKPLVPTLERFAQDNALSLTYVLDPQPRTDPHYRLVWVNDSGQTCSLYLQWLGGDRYEVRLLRWGSHDLIGERVWPLRATDTAPSELALILAESRAWCDAPRSE